MTLVGVGVRACRHIFAALAVAASVNVIVALPAARAGVKGSGAIGPRKTPSSHTRAEPSGTFHLVYHGIEAEGAAVMVDVLVKPATKTIVGVFEMTKPNKVRSHISGSYTQDTASAGTTADLVGFPQSMMCFHGPAVSENVKLALRIERGWRNGTLDVAYRGDAVTGQPSEWATLPGVTFAGSAPIRWREASDIVWSGGSPIAWSGDCFDTDERESRRLARLGSDASRKKLTLLSTPDQATMTAWSIRNDSKSHILAAVRCAAPDQGRIEPTRATILLHPLETRPLFGFFNKQRQACTLVRSHYD